MDNSNQTANLTPKVSVTPDAIGRYLFSRKWRLKRFDHRIAEFEYRGKSGLIGLEVPVNPKARDYIRQLSEVLVNLSILEHRPQTDIYYDILKEATPSFGQKAAYLGIGLVVFGFSLYSWLVMWGV